MNWLLEGAPERSLGPRMAVLSVGFAGATHLAPARLKRIAARYTGKSFDDTDWLNELAERVRDAEQQRGYFCVLPVAAAKILWERNRRQGIAVTVRIEEGDQYRLKSFSVVNAKAFPAEELVARFGLRPGDIFNTAVIRRGLEDLRKTYGAKGYINFTAVPDTQIDDAARTIALVVDVDEGDAYRVGKVQFLGLSPGRTEQVLRDFPLKPGDAYSPRDVEEFYRRNHSLLPRGPNFGIENFLQLDNEHHLVDIVFDFRAWCDKIPMGCRTLQPSANKK